MPAGETCDIIPGKGKLCGAELRFFKVHFMIDFRLLWLEFLLIFRYNSSWVAN